MDPYEVIGIATVYLGENANVGATTGAAGALGS